MAVRSGRRVWTALAAGCCLAALVAWLTGAAAPGHPAGSRTGANRPGPLSGSRVSALQFNLCNSGIARCFTGRSVGAAAEVIRDERPTIVTLNEICRGDVSVLKQAMSDTGSGTHIVSAFKAVPDRDTHKAFRCRNGEPYGIGVLASIPSSVSKDRVYGGVYPVQDLADPEERVWLCIDVAGEYFACTTHAADTSTTVALAQCRYLLSSAVPMVRVDSDDPVILGADLNLPAGDRPGPQSCLPHGYMRADDGARQDIVTSPGIAVRSRTVIDMHGTTDHPGLFVVLG